MTAGIGMVALLAMAPLLATAGLAAPPWALLLLMGFWLALVLLGSLWFSRRPKTVVALPLLAGAAWWVLIAAGEGLGWTA